jgi:xanthine dehydrogenase accessory factor
MNSEFKNIIDSIRDKQITSISRTVNGVEYHRRFIPEDRLILLGAGHVSQATAQFAALLGFYIVVVDDRPEFANSDRFPMAGEIVCDNFTDAIDHLKITPEDYVCVLTRGHRYDADCVRHILSGPQMPYYIGMIGSKRRVADFREILRQEGCPEEKNEALHSPIGLKIGGITPAEIGLSICAELIQERSRNYVKDGIEYLEQTNCDLKTLEYLADGGEPRAFIMAIDADGSTPAKPGAIMAINKLGKTYGTVGGGCSEAAVIGRARRIIGTGGSDVVEVDMTNEVAAEMGMVCGGTLWVYIEDLKDDK